MFCHKCGKEIKENMIYCFNCGEKVLNQRIKYCHKCGSELEAEGKFCSICGEIVGDDKYKMSEDNQIQKKKSKAWIFIVLTIAVIGIVAVVLLMSAKGNDKLSKQLDLAQQYLMEMDYEQAIAAYEEAIKIDPKSTDAYLGLSEVYAVMADEEIEAGNIDLAMEYYENAIEVIKVGEAKTGEQSLTDFRTEIKEKKKEAKQQKQPTEEVEQSIKSVEEDAVDDEIVASDEEEEFFVGMSAEEILQASVGDIVTYGEYAISYREYGWNDDDTLATETSKTSLEEAPIEWIVLENDGVSVTLLSKYVLDDILYNHEFKPITWENSEIRAWLNDDFYSIAFTDTEKAYIQTTTCVNADNPYYGVGGQVQHVQFGEEGYPAGGNDTQDKVYLLSLAEIEQYFGVTTADWNRCEYADFQEGGDLDWKAYGTLCNEKSGGLLVAENPALGGADWWWLRSPGVHSGKAAGVSCGVYVYGYDVICDLGVRPVIKITL